MKHATVAPFALHLRVHAPLESDFGSPCLQRSPPAFALARALGGGRQSASRRDRVEDPGPRAPTDPASRPSTREAIGLLPAQAMAHMAMTLAIRSGPAYLSSRVRVAELAIRPASPAELAAATLSHIHGVSTKMTIDMPSSARAVAARRSDGRWRGRRTDPITHPAPGAAMTTRTSLLAHASLWRA
jgi:hypothetical protein